MAVGALSCCFSLNFSWTKIHKWRYIFVYALTIILWGTEDLAATQVLAGRSVGVAICRLHWCTGLLSLQYVWQSEKN